MRGDPRWIIARRGDHCARCRKPIPANAGAFYYPNTRRLLCEADECGGQASRDFEAARADEDGF